MRVWGGPSGELRGTTPCGGSAFPTNICCGFEHLMRLWGHLMRLYKHLIRVQASMLRGYGPGTPDLMLRKYCPGNT